MECRVVNFAILGFKSEDKRQDSSILCSCSIVDWTDLLWHDNFEEFNCFLQGILVLGTCIHPICPQPLRLEAKYGTIDNSTFHDLLSGGTLREILYRAVTKNMTTPPKSTKRLNKPWGLVIKEGDHGGKVGQFWQDYTSGK